MFSWIRRVREGIRCAAMAGCDLLWTPRCLSCDADLFEEEGNRHDYRDLPLCPECIKLLGPEVWHGCRRCGSKLAETAVARDDCPACRKARLHMDAVIPLGAYHEKLRYAVLRMKRPAHDPLSQAMGRLLVRRRREQLAAVRPDMIIPVPMFWWRRLRRGKNNPDVLAGCLAESLGISVQHGVLVRRRNTLPQASLPPTRRFRNVRGAFRVRRPTAVQGARVLLVDDVLTTGATCSEAAKTLKRAGAAAVAVAVVARAGRKDYG